MTHSKVTLFTAASAALIAGILIGTASAPLGYAGKKDAEPYKRLDTFAQVLSVVEQNYVDEIDRTSVIDGAIHGMIRALDPHSSFFTKQQRIEFEQRTSGKFAGIGIEVGIKNDELRILIAFHGSPAQKAGLASGDTILAVDGQNVSKMSLDDIFDALRGAPGSVVKLTVRHPEKLSIETISVKREIVQLELVLSRLLDDNIGYAQIKSFGVGTTKMLREKIDNLNAIADGGKLSGLVLDLRKNPGGFLTEGVGTANLFIESGDIVSTRGRDGVHIKTYAASRHDYAYDMPLAVLIDESSASAAEIVAGALRDHHRAVIVGETSFGKASIQNMYTLKDGSTVKLTIGKYYTPSGQCIQAQGITPDVVVEDLILQTRKRTSVREKDLAHALSASPGQQAAAPPQSPAIDDLQLFTAVQQLRARDFYLRKYE